MRVDYATIGALHLANPAWDIPVVSLSANNNPYYYSDASLDEMETLGAATARAVERTGRRAVLLASNSLSHLHWDVEPELPEDMARGAPVLARPVRRGHGAAAGDPGGPDRAAEDGDPRAHRGHPGRDQGRQPDLAARRDGLARRSPATCSPTARSSAPATRSIDGWPPMIARHADLLEGRR